MPAYARPTRFEDALRILARGERTVLAGGTDYYPAHVGRPCTEDILDVTALPELRGITEHAGHWRIGATTTWMQVAGANLPPVFDCLKLAAREVGGEQIQNAGTVAGNICNASPAADGVPALLALDASVELSRDGGARTLALDDFIVGARKTARKPNELVSALLVPKPRYAARSGFLKLGARRYLVISIAVVAAVLEHDQGIVRRARIAVGACSPVARRLSALEDELVGKPFAPGLGGCVRQQHLEPLSPIDDVRGSAAYRGDATLTLVRRALDALA